MFVKMFKINKEVRQFQAGEYIGFGFQFSSKYKNFKTKEDVWTNYKAVVFSKSPAQISFYQSAFVKGTAVALVAEDIVIDTYTNDAGVNYNSIELVNARVSGVVTADNGQPTAQGVTAPAPQQPAQGGLPMDDELPF